MYRTLNSYLQETFGCKVYKLSLDGGMTCPNRDGTCGTGGCIFCSGSGEFAARGETVAEQLTAAKQRVAHKNRGGKYIAYFQNFTNTYAPPERLRRLYAEATAPEDVVALSVGTRPDCLPPEVLEVLSEQKKPVFVELGLQTVHEETAKWMRRGYELPVYDRAVRELKARGIHVVTHMIAGLPGESREMTVETARYIGASGSEGIKIHLLHVLRGTDLEAEYLQGRVPVLSMEDYIETVAQCLRVLPPDMVIHRLTGDGDKRTLLAPLWSADKKTVLNAMNRRLQNITQGEAL